MAKIECEKCKNKFESKGWTSICDSCRRKRTPKIYMYAAIGVILLGLFAGIVLGNVYSIEKIDEDSILDTTEEVFNTNLLIISLTSGAFASIPLFGLSSINYRLNLLIDKSEN